MVHYDPKDPGGGLPEAGLSWRVFMPLMGGLCFLVVGILKIRCEGRSDFIKKYREIKYHDPCHQCDIS
jgi:hypothetical protein